MIQRDYILELTERAWADNPAAQETPDPYEPEPSTEPVRQQLGPDGLPF